MKLILRKTEIQNCIFTIRSRQVMIDSDLARLYNVETKVLNQAVKRNLKRFPNSFKFKLTNAERNELVTKCDRFEKLKHSSVLPYAFTEQGVAMLSAVLNSDVAIRVSIQIMNAFVELRKLKSESLQIIPRIESIERNQIEINHKFDKIFKALEGKRKPADHGIFFEGQVFDAYTLLCEIIRSAKKSIIIVDNYVDESVLTLLTKRNKKVEAKIFTKRISKALTLDIVKHNAQYAPIEIQLINDVHDRFIVIDEIELYHVGASLKDAGKKWFAFSKLNTLKDDLLKRLKK